RRARARAPRARPRGAPPRPRARRSPRCRSRRRASRPQRRCRRSRSARTIISTSSRKETRGAQPSTRRALEASPTRRSTSAGRSNAGSPSTCWPHSGAEETALGLEVEHPLAFGRSQWNDATDLGRALPEVLALESTRMRGGKVQLIVRGAVAPLDVDRRIAPAQRVEPAESLRQNRAVRLDAVAVARLETVPRVVGSEERLLRPVVPVEDERGHLLVAGASVELAPEPPGHLGGSRERELLDRALAIEAGRRLPLPRAPEEE